MLEESLCCEDDPRVGEAKRSLCLVLTDLGMVLLHVQEESWAKVLFFTIIIQKTWIFLRGCTRGFVLLALVKYSNFCFFLKSWNQWGWGWSQRVVVKTPSDLPDWKEGCVEDARCFKRTGVSDDLEAVAGGGVDDVQDKVAMNQVRGWSFYLTYLTNLECAGEMRVWLGASAVSGLWRCGGAGGRVGGWMISPI